MNTGFDDLLRSIKFREAQFFWSIADISNEPLNANIHCGQKVVLLPGDQVTCYSHVQLIEVFGKAWEDLEIQLGKRNVPNFIDEHFPNNVLITKILEHGKIIHYFVHIDLWKVISELKKKRIAKKAIFIPDYMVLKNNNAWIGSKNKKQWITANLSGEFWFASGPKLASVLIDRIKALDARSQITLNMKQNNSEVCQLKFIKDDPLFVKRHWELDEISASDFFAAQKYEEFGLFEAKKSPRILQFCCNLGAIFFIIVLVLHNWSNLNFSIPIVEGYSKEVFATQVDQIREIERGKKTIFFRYLKFLEVLESHGREHNFSVSQIILSDNFELTIIYVTDSHREAHLIYEFVNENFATEKIRSERDIDGRIVTQIEISAK